ncbi:MAG: xylulokinase, partial [Clostridia bacterium]|nr:xylulokinase [Clostridia bacterium]
MESKYIIAHDMGTSSDKAVLVDMQGKIIATQTEAYPTYYPAPAFVEQVPDDYWRAVCEATAKLVDKTGISAEQVKGVVFSTQAMGIIPIDK